MKNLHRGAQGDMATFAERFIRGRIIGFQKDMRICLTMIPKPEGGGMTCAYFPALSSCCSMMEYLAGLYAGDVEDVTKREVGDYAEAFMPQPMYAREAIRILVDAFRNRVNHRGIASGVWVDPHAQHANRRLIWNIEEDESVPPLDISDYPGEVRRDSPWPCPYTHRVTIGLPQLARDIAASIERYIQAIHDDSEIQNRFEACMNQLYPR